MSVRLGVAAMALAAAAAAPTQSLPEMRMTVDEIRASALDGNQIRRAGLPGGHTKMLFGAYELEHAAEALCHLIYLDDLHVGRRFTSGPHALDKRQITAFASEFDPQPFHVDREAAKATLFHGLAAR